MAQEEERDHNAGVSTSRKRKTRKTHVKIQYMQPEHSKDAPFVGYFPSGFDPVSANAETGLDAEVYQNSKKFKAKQMQLVVTPKECSVDFVGTNYSGEAAQWKPRAYLIGIFDKKNKTLNLAPVAGERVFRMEPRVRGMHYEDLLNDGVDEQVTPEQRRLHYQRLVQTFGNTRSRTMQKRLEKSILKDDALDDTSGLGKMMGVEIKESNVLTQEEAIAKLNEHIVRNVPPYDASATVPQNIYLLEKIIFKDEWSQQPDIAELIKAGENSIASEAFKEERADYPLFVRNRIHNLKPLNNEKRDRLAHVFSYITHLIKFRDMPIQDIKKLWKALKPGSASEYESDDHVRKITEALQIPPITLNKFLKHFTESGKARPKDKENLLISYILVLTLIADDFETNPFDIASDLKKESHDVKVHYEELGCKAHGGQKNKKFRLTAPLKFPDMKLYKRRR